MTSCFPKNQVPPFFQLETLCAIFKAIIPINQFSPITWSYTDVRISNHSLRQFDYWKKCGPAQRSRFPKLKIRRLFLHRRQLTLGNEKFSRHCDSITKFAHNHFSSDMRRNSRWYPFGDTRQIYAPWSPIIILLATRRDCTCASGIAREEYDDPEPAIQFLFARKKIFSLYLYFRITWVISGAGAFQSPCSRSRFFPSTKFLPPLLLAVCLPVHRETPPHPRSRRRASKQFSPVLAGSFPCAPFSQSGEVRETE